MLYRNLKLKISSGAVGSATNTLPELEQAFERLTSHLKSLKTRYGYGQDVDNIIAVCPTKIGLSAESLSSKLIEMSDKLKDFSNAQARLAVYNLKEIWKQQAELLKSFVPARSRVLGKEWLDRLFGVAIQHTFSSLETRTTDSLKLLEAWLAKGFEPSREESVSFGNERHRGLVLSFKGNEIIVDGGFKLIDPGAPYPLLITTVDSWKNLIISKNQPNQESEALTR